MISPVSYYETKKMQILWNKFCIFNNFNNLELCLNSDAANMESGYIIFICMTNSKCNRSATKTPSHKEKILISKQHMKGENSFQKNQMTILLIVSNF